VVIAETNGPVDLESIVALDADGYILNLGSRDILLKALELTLLDQQVFVLGSPIAKPTDRPDARSLESARRTDPRGSDGPGAGAAAMQLSDRERQVLISLAHGRSNKAIARLCQLSEATVKVHLKAILRKTNTRNRTQAAIWALRHQLREGAVAEVTKPADPPKLAPAESMAE
jgi:two-component system, NarL family, nitrate/nitrite response regulator NarL